MKNQTKLDIVTFMVAKSTNTLARIVKGMGQERVKEAADAVRADINNVSVDAATATFAAEQIANEDD